MTPEALTVVRDVVKKGAVSDQMQADYAAQMRADTLKSIGKFILAAGGAGLGARGLVGLSHLVKRPSIPVSQDLVPVDIPLPGRKRREQDEAGLKLGGVADWPGDYIKKLLSGQEATTPAGIPYAMPLATLGGMGAAYGGWKLMDHALDSRRKSQMAKEKLRAKKELHEALLSEFSNEKTSAAKSSLGRDLDRLYSLTVKKAVNRYDVGGAALGTYGTVAGIAALASAVAAYKHIKARSNGELLKKTMKIRNRRLYNQQPTPLWAQIENDPSQQLEEPAGAQVPDLA